MMEKRLDVARMEMALKLIGNELVGARGKFSPFNSGHEGYAVIKEELDELWDAVKLGDTAHAKVEAMQVAATALAFMLEIGRDR